MRTNQKMANLETDRVARLCMDRPDVAPFAYVVGRWVWVEFPSSAKPSADTCKWLRATGFYFNRKRALWQHQCGIACKRIQADPRNFYARHEIEEVAS